MGLLGSYTLTPTIVVAAVSGCSGPVMQQWVFSRLSLLVAGVRNSRSCVGVLLVVNICVSLTTEVSVAMPLIVLPTTVLLCVLGPGVTLKRL